MASFRRPQAPRPLRPSFPPASARSKLLASPRARHLTKLPRLGLALLAQPPTPLLSRPPLFLSALPNLAPSPTLTPSVRRPSPTCVLLRMGWLLHPRFGFSLRRALDVPFVIEFPRASWTCSALIWLVSLVPLVLLFRMLRSLPLAYTDKHSYITSACRCPFVKSDSDFPTISQCGGSRRACVSGAMVFMTKQMSSLCCTDHELPALVTSCPVSFMPTWRGQWEMMGRR